MAELAPWASDARRSRGRRIAEPGLDAAQGFRIDRERIVHCTAFRRLAYKTQVFINHQGDLGRTRLPMVTSATCKCLMAHCGTMTGMPYGR